jgi:signal peptidase I
VTKPDDTTAAMGRDPGTSASRSSSAVPRRSRARKQLPIWQEMLLLLVVALVLAVVIKAFFVQAFYIPSGSMEDTLVPDDRILVEKLSYWGDDSPQRGDIVVFDDPGRWLRPSEVQHADNPVTKALELFGLYPTGGHLVKRVIGVAGDTVSCCDARGRLDVNGHPLDTSGVTARSGEKCDGPEVDSCQGDWTVGPVPAGDLFVMGDNRAHSADSAYHVCHPRAAGCGQGPVFVPVSDVVGKAVLLMWPFGRAHVLHRPPGFAAVAN